MNKDQPKAKEADVDDPSIWNNDIEEAILGHPKTCDQVNTGETTADVKNTPRKSSNQSGSSDKSQKSKKSSKKKQSKGKYLNGVIILI